MKNLMTAITSEHPGIACTFPEEECNCTKKELWKQEEKQYWITSALAIAAGIVGALIGYRFSMATLSDSFHAFADGLADMWGVYVVKNIHKTPEREIVLRRKGTQVVAVLLLLSAIFILHEAWGRFNGNSYLVSPIWIMIAGIVTGIIDITRVYILSSAQSHNPNEMRGGLILHAVIDFRRSEAIAAMGFLMIVGQLLAQYLEVIIDVELRMIDLAISLGISGFIIRIAYLMWRGEHSHSHQKLRFERWFLQKFFGIKLPHSHHHAH